MKHSFVILSFLFIFSVIEPKILHISFHLGCSKEIEYVARKLNLDITSIFIHRDWPGKEFDGKSSGGEIYNITADRANNVWNLHKDFFDQFDAIITSDTAALSRIFLQNNHWKKPLIIWVCNRFDYADGATAKGLFPDKQYYQLFKKATTQSNVKIVSYNAFEYHYAKSKGIDIGPTVIKPIGGYDEQPVASSIPKTIVKKDTFFSPPYLNDTRFMKVAQHCRSLGIPTYNGRYAGPMDLRGFKGIIHLPYAWSNLAFFENLYSGLPYFVPSKRFIHQLNRQGRYFIPDASYFFFDNQEELSEWYAPEHKDIITYFDSWEDLQKKIATTNFEELSSKIKKFGKQHKITMLHRWNEVLTCLQKQK